MRWLPVIQPHVTHTPKGECHTNNTDMRHGAQLQSDTRNDAPPLHNAGMHTAVQHHKLLTHGQPTSKSSLAASS